MSINLQLPKLTDLEPRLTVIGVGGAGCNAVNNMIAAGLTGVEFVVANTDAQALAASSAEHRIQLGVNLTEGLGAGAKPEIGEAAAEEVVDEIRAQVSGSHMVFLAAGMGGGTGTGAASVIARVARELGILVVGVVTKPFQFEGSRRMRVAEAGIEELKQCVDTLIVIPNQNLFRIANEKTTFAEAFVLADHVLYSGVACIVDLIIKEGLINLDFADVRSVMAGMGTAMMGTGEASGEGRATLAAEEAIYNPLLDDISLSGAKGLLLSIIGGSDLTLYEVDEAASRVRKEVDAEATIIVGATFDDTLEDKIRVSIVASGMDRITQPNTSGVFMGLERPSAGARRSVPSAPASGSTPPHTAPLPPGVSQGARPGFTAPEAEAMARSSPTASPSVFDTAREAAASMGTGNSSASPPPVPGDQPQDMQRRLSEAIQSDGGAARGADPSMSGVWDDDPDAQEFGAGDASTQQAAQSDRWDNGSEYPSEDIGQGATNDVYARGDNAQPQWEAHSGVIIEEGLPPISRGPADEGGAAHPPRAETGAMPDDPAAAQFQPQPPPADIRRTGRRMPTVEDFPDVGQREYRAHMAEQGGYGQSHAEGQQRGAIPQPSQADRKPGLFARLTGIGLKRSDSFSSADQTRHARHIESNAAGYSAHDANVNSPRQGFNPDESEGEEPSELPVFFSRQNKG